MSSGKAFPLKSESHYLTCMGDNCSKAYCVDRREYEHELLAKDKEIAKLRAALEDAVQAVNTMQTLLMQSGLVTNSGAVSTNIKLAFNRGAKFLSDNSEMQTAYLKRVYKQREALAGIPHEEVRKFVETAGDAPRRNKDET